MKERVVLVDLQNVPIGTMEKMQAHRQGLLHRAFSIYLFNPTNELLLQKRAFDKYHSGGLWTNTCCGHPRPEEEITVAAKRRLMEEMGIDIALTEISQLTYKAELDHGLTEHEYLHVFVGTYADNPIPNKAEVEDWKWQKAEQVRHEMGQHPAQFTAWFPIVFPHLKPHEHIY